MPYLPAVLAVVFDFDETLVPDSTTKLLVSRGVDPDQFWKVDVQRLVSQGYDPPLAYLTLLVDMVGPSNPLGELSISSLNEFGAALDGDFFPGLPDIFDELRATVHRYKDMTIEFYIVSGGLEAIVLGSGIVRQHFTGVYGCRLAEDPKSGLVARIARSITFSEKTRYLFEINKGIDPNQSNPYLVNKDLPIPDRRIPFRNIIYIGDGLTDIPCFSLVKKEGGVAFGVFQPGEESSAKRAFNEFLRPARVVSMHAPRYGPQDELGSLLRTAVATRCSQIVLERGGA